MGEYNVDGKREELPQAAMLDKLAVAATAAAHSGKRLRVVRKWLGPAYAWAHVPASAGGEFRVRSGMYRLQPVVDIDQSTQVERCVGIAPERSLKLREIEYTQHELLGGEWVGRLTTYSFNWDQDKATRAEREIKAVPSMTSKEVEFLREFYGIDEDHPQLAEMLFETDCDTQSVSARDCADLLRRYRRGVRDGDIAA